MGACTSLLCVNNRQIGRQAARRVPTSVFTRAYNEMSTPVQDFFPSQYACPSRRRRGVQDHGSASRTRGDAEQMLRASACSASLRKETRFSITEMLRAQCAPAEGLRRALPSERT